MKTKIEIHSCNETYCVIHAQENTNSVQQLAEKISLLDKEGREGILNGWDGDFCIRTAIKDVYRIFSQDKKVYFIAAGQEFLLKQRLYEIEELAQQNGWMDFIRISNTDIVNLAHVVRLDLTLAGMINVVLDDDSTVPVSRRYMKSVKEVLKLRPCNF